MASHRCYSSGITTVKLLAMMVTVTMVMVVMVLSVWRTTNVDVNDNNNNDDDDEDVLSNDDGDDLGFSLMFRSNREEMQDVPIHFDPPLPVWLSGTLIRNGLGLFENGDRRFQHLFDGMAKLTSWRFPGNGSAFFSTRFLATEFYTASMAGNTISPYLMLEQPQPPFGFVDSFRALLRGLDNMNVNVYRWPSSEGGGGGHDYLALSDYWKGYTFDPRNLTTRSPVTGKLSHGFAESLGVTSFLRLLSSAHPLPEPGTGHHLTFLSSLSMLPLTGGHLMQLVRVRSTQEREVVASWRVDRIPYMHSFSVTETHALLLAHPFYLDALCMIYRVTPFRCLDWRGEEAATLYVVELKTGRMTELTMENVFSMHHVNAYNAGEGRIVMDLSTYPDPSLVGLLQLPILHDPAARNGFAVHARLRRYEVNLLTREVNRVEMTPPPRPGFIEFMDMPSLNERYRSRHYCYVYGLVCKTDNATLGRVAIVKRDVCGASGDWSWSLPGHYPVEPVFVPRPAGQRSVVAEDEGVVLVPMIDGPSRRSYMAVLDARDLSLLSTASLPTLVPYSLHGQFFPEVL